MTVIAIDGKTARGSFKTKSRKDALHMVSAWSCKHGLVLGQQRVDSKSNEIISKIRKKGGDYVIALKVLYVSAVSDS